MYEKRRDSKGRILRTGESQRKDGRYAYKYMDGYGKPRFVYAWKLVATDRTPPGKRDDCSLREKIREIQRDLDDGINPYGKRLTVCQLYEKQIRSKRNVKLNTKKGREHLMSLLRSDPFGARSIDSVRKSDAKDWAIRMSERGYAYKTISNYKRSLKAAFYLAIEEDYIRKNPFNWEMEDILEDDTESKTVLTPEQESSLLAFMEADPTYRKYYDDIVVLLETGLRISEFCGLTTKLDFMNRRLHIDHQLLRDKEIGYYISTPKTDCGYRDIPMTERCYMALKRIVKNRGKATPLKVNGYTNFLFLKQDGLPRTRDNYDSMVSGLVKKYNKWHRDNPLPKVTPHTFRHTFCTRMANAGMLPTTLQYIMGHANITMTLGYYTHTTFESAQVEMARVEAARIEQCKKAA